MAEVAKMGNKKVPVHSSNNGVVNKTSKTPEKKSNLPNTFSVQQRLASLKQLGAMSVKYEKVIEKESEMKTFLAEADGTQEFVIFGSGDQAKVRITNTVIIRKLAKLFLNDLEVYKEAVEDEILKFDFDNA